MDRRSQNWTALQMLVLCTAFWGLSFPAMKSLAMTQQALLPGANTWFLASFCIVCRFGSAAIIVALISWRTIGKCSRSEVYQGVGLGVFGGGGLLLQMDGLQYTAASTSAFLTQCYAVFIPLWLALRRRQCPSRVVLASCGLVMAGVAILAEVNWRDLRMGRGELETIAGSVLFTGQILWLDRREYAANNPNHFSAVMFAVMALGCLPVALLTTSQPSDWRQAFGHPATFVFLGLLVFFCTLGGYMLMNHWQRFVPATQAGLIYSLEPVFASVFAWFLPGWFSAAAGIAYPNEILTKGLLAGGGLIIAANILIQMAPGENLTGKEGQLEVNKLRSFDTDQAA